MSYRVDIPREEIIGKTDIEVYGKERGEHYRDVDFKIIEEGNSYQVQEVYETLTARDTFLS